MQLLEILIPATEQYPLTISGFDVVNITTDPFYTINNHYSWSLNGSKFTTRDRDNDQSSNRNCPVNWYGPRAGGWWYNICSALYVNDVYKHLNTIYLNGNYHALSLLK